jgi:chorismate mutase
MSEIAIEIGLLILFLWYLSFSATRLDRLHHRVESSWAALDSLLQRRAAIALEIAHSQFADPGLSLILNQAAHQAREAEISERSDAESGLTTALGMLLENESENFDNREDQLIKELAQITDRIRVAVKLHVEAVNRTKLIRRKLIVRTFRLAGRAPLPTIYRFEEDAI